jgi:4-alpha-glucanotransferase
MNIPRSCGIILHISSLPSPFGIGDLGPAAYRFADFLASSSIRYWQILPLNYTEEGSGFSPYSGLSAFAGNTFLISPEVLREQGLLDDKECQPDTTFPTAVVDYPAMVKYKRSVFDAVYRNFRKHGSADLDQKFSSFCEANGSWLEDYALYMALKTQHGGKAWSDWPEEIRNRDAKALQIASEELRDDVDKQRFLQFLFDVQWNALKEYCEERQISFIGDLPIYVGYDSADVWANSLYFKLDEDRKPTVVAGVPPDYFSETGQLWGMPIFDWETLKKEKYAWWMDRIAHNMHMFGILRLDHFRAFAAYWEVPANEKTAIRGKWVEGPGADFFKQLKKKFPDMPFIAEDLGEIDQPVRDLMTQFSLPGMRVLQFAFGDDWPRSVYIPHHHVPHSVVYTGTHDNNTIVGWYEKDLDRKGKKRLEAYLGKKLRQQTVHEEMIRLALQSVGQLAVFPIQDLLGLGSEAIMNKPSTTKGNWAWRFSEEMLTPELSIRIRTWLQLYDREGRHEEKEKGAGKKKKSKTQKKPARPSGLASAPPTGKPVSGRLQETGHAPN